MNQHEVNREVTEFTMDLSDYIEKMVELFHKRTGETIADIRIDFNENCVEEERDYVEVDTFLKSEFGGIE